MSHMTYFWLGVASALAVAVAAVAGLRTRLIFVESALDKLAKRLAWQDAQSKAPELGAHRTAPYAFAATERADGSCATCGRHWMQTCICDSRAAKPEPTSVPSKGRIFER